MPTFRPDLAQIPVYTPGRPIEEVARDFGIEEVIKLASNECPVPPFPEVRRAIADATADLHRYPENSAYVLVAGLSDHYQIPGENIWVSAGSTQVLGSIAMSAGGRGTSMVFAQPSFVMYGIYAMICGSESIAVPLDAQHRHDLDEMLAAIREDTTVVYLCNPNNPTGTHNSGDEVRRFIDAVADRVLIVVDEAYAEFATAEDYASSIPLALERDNVIVTRTFSKAYGLAGLRVGYAIGQAGTVAMLRRTQLPFTVTSLGQVAATEALRHQDQLRQRIADNAAGRAWLTEQLGARNVAVAPSQANFVMVLTHHDPAALARAFLERGVIIRTLGSMTRVSVGTPAENERFISVWDEVAPTLAASH